MPIYEYACTHCGRISNFFVRNIAAHAPPSCPHCGYKEMRRTVSRFATLSHRKTEGTCLEKKNVPDADFKQENRESFPEAHEAASDQDFSEIESLLDQVDENDPRSMGRALRKLAEQSGEPMDEEMDEAVRRLEAGEDPEKIEEKMGGGAGDDSTEEWYDG